MYSEQTTLKRLTCGKCAYEWLYKGRSPFWTSCPRCRTNVKTNVDGMAGLAEFNKKEAVTR
ncbi:hypothetical protein NTE_01883 [Candidatus Nitrososphaera evergladensis SR1]|uniref:Uncharacterized protein n=1 Tax=Candidatus Nitrososphaera evergladensis SR1 TaxID=1459636 RepID=A0A075MT18_9ARCH|nr:hypothetical protein NTE_01883 [Candidatus Nitrososphaera evergladensis SR1]